MKNLSINLANKLSKISDFWSPRVIAEMTDHTHAIASTWQAKLAKLEGEFVWHEHANADETFLVIDGELDIELRDGTVTLRVGELFVVPRGVEHRPIANSECHVLILEPKGVVNTGEAGGPLTADQDQWI